MSLPDFLIVGAMKCGTSTLQAQLASQQGVFMTTPKEPNFFSDDDVYERGVDWYRGLFAGAAEGSLKGEASTHYTKAPTYPNCIERMKAVLEPPKIIYMIRNPVDRIVSQYIHEWTMGKTKGDIAAEVAENPAFEAYSRYADQIAPYVEWVGAENIYLSSMERLKADGPAELAAVCAFLGLPQPTWVREAAQMNSSAERIRRFPGSDLLIHHPFAAALRRRLVPQALRSFIKERLQITERPTLTPDQYDALTAKFQRDFERLKVWFPDTARYAECYETQDRG